MLLLGALVLWVFACWVLRATLGTLQVQSVLSQVIPALLMVVLVVATPLVFWQILAEYAAVYIVTEQGLRYHSLGVSLTIPWETIEHVSDDQTQGFTLRLTDNVSRQIANPLLRFLHNQSNGRRLLAIPAGVERRDELIEAIMARGFVEQPTTREIREQRD